MKETFYKVIDVLAEEIKRKELDLKYNRMQIERLEKRITELEGKKE